MRGRAVLQRLTCAQSFRYNILLCIDMLYAYCFALPLNCLQYEYLDGSLFFCCCCFVLCKFVFFSLSGIVTNIEYLKINKTESKLNVRNIHVPICNVLP